MDHSMFEEDERNWTDNDETDEMDRHCHAAAGCASSSTGAVSAKYEATANEKSTVSTTASALIIAAGDKAGMEGIDRTRIDAIILRESGESAFMKQQRKRDKNVNDKIEQMKNELYEKDHPKPGCASSTSCGNPRVWRRKLQETLELEINDHLSKRRTQSTCVVVDMDSFYISCELLTRPELRNVPACVGQGMILTSNYCARRYGVRSAMAGWIGDKLVSEISNGKKKLHHIPSNFDLYTKQSQTVRRVLAEYDPHMRAYSLDEVYLDIGLYLALKLGRGWPHERIVAALKLPLPQSRSRKCALELDDDGNDGDSDNDNDNDDANNDENGIPQRCDCEDLVARFSQKQLLFTTTTVVAEMRHNVQQATNGLTCSAGVASNFMLAKIGSDRNKPNGQLVVGPSHNDVLSFVQELPIRKIPGIGRVTEKMLNAFDIFTVKDLFVERALVRFLFKPATAGFLLRASLGCGSDSHNNDDEKCDSESAGQKGMSRERTFSAGKPWAEVNSRLEDIARKLSNDMKKKNIVGGAHTLTVKVKLDTFDILSRAKSMPRGVYLQDPDEMVSIATGLLQEIKKQHLRNNRKGSESSFSVRLLGVRCSNFQENSDDNADKNQMGIQQFLSSRSSPTKREPSVNGAIVQPIVEGGVGLGKVGVSKMQAMGKEEKVEYIGDATWSGNIVAVVEASTIQAPAVAVADTEEESSFLAAPPSPLVQTVDQAQAQEVRCPLCNNKITDKDNDALNKHIDSCLSFSLVREAVREESAAAQYDNKQRKKKQRLTDFFGGG